jgi:murein DD-endopeptidase MepM/ murein hydrolase activator NlpD
VLPDVEGVSVACEANTLVVPLAEPKTPVSRVEAGPGTLYTLIMGELIAFDVDELESGVGNGRVLLEVGDMVGTRPVQELTDLVITPEGETLYLLDKSGSLYRYDLTTDDATLIYNGREIDIPVGPQFLAVELDAAGEPVLFDSANGYVWKPRDQFNVNRLRASRGLITGHDFARIDETYYVLRQDNIIMQATEGSGADVYQEATGRDLGLAVKVSAHLGSEVLITVDATRREVVTITPADAVPVARHAYAFPGMGLLRDAVFSDGRLYGVADHQLYVYPGPSQDGLPSTASCPPPTAQATPTLYGVDLIAAAEDFIYPVEDATLPVWPRVYPGASRLYRYGVHRGVDIYSFNAPDGFRTGWPARVMGNGTVIESTIPYEGINSTIFQVMLRESRAAGQTPPDLLRDFYGKYLMVEHTNGLISLYAHLDELNQELTPGTLIRQGDSIGTVGVTGTSGEFNPVTVSPHLHFDIYIGERYLGQGVTIRETMWWFAQMFPEAVLR